MMYTEIVGVDVSGGENSPLLSVSAGRKGLKGGGRSGGFMKGQ
jgi:hypothetical protein